MSVKTALLSVLACPLLVKHLVKPSNDTEAHVALSG